MFLVGVQAVGRLVQDQHVGIVQQGGGEPDASFEAFGKRLDRLVQHTAELKALGHLIDAVQLVVTL